MISGFDTRTCGFCTPWPWTIPGLPRMSLSMETVWGKWGKSSNLDLDSWSANLDHG